MLKNESSRPLLPRRAAPAPGRCSHWPAEQRNTSNMADTQEVIALCSVGNLGKYLCEELLADGRYSFVVISRQVSQKT